MPEQTTLYILNEIIQIKANIFAVGHSSNAKIMNFTNHEIEIQKGDIIYIFSDGYADQFGGENGEEKFMYHQFRELLLKIAKEDMDRQHRLLDENLTKWMNGTEQLDDVLVIGFKI